MAMETRARPPSRPGNKAVPPHGRTDRPAWATTAIHDRSWKSRGGNPRIFWANYNDLTATSLESWIIRESSQNGLISG